MPFAITYIVQSFQKQSKKLVADQPHKMKTAESAVTGARRLVDKKAGVVAYSVGHERITAISVCRLTTNAPTARAPQRDSMISLVRSFAF
jgi:hypothetical protein